MNTTFASLRVRNFRCYFTGSIVSNVGTWMHRMAQDWLVLSVTGSAASLGLATGLQFLPILLFAPFAGVLADRYSKRFLLVLTQAAMGLTAAALGLLAVTGGLRAGHLYVLAFLFGAGWACEIPVRQAFVNEMVDDERVSNAVGLNSVAFNSAQLIGPPLAGLLIAGMGSGRAAAGRVILLNAVARGAVLASLAVMRRSELAPSTPVPRAPGQLREAVRYVRRRPDIVLVAVVVFFAVTFAFNFQITTLLMATEVYGRGARGFGVLGAFTALGSIAGALLAARRPRPRQRLIVLGAIGLGIVVALSGLMPTYVTFAMVLPVCGVASLTVLTSANAYIQTSTEPAIRGRVMALYLTVFLGSRPVGAPIIGWLAEHLGPRSTLIGGGTVSALGAAATALVLAPRQGIRVPELRQWRRVLRRPPFGGRSATARPVVAARRSSGRDTWR